MNLELMSASSQRGQLLSIIDDLNVKLKKTRALLPEADKLKQTQMAHDDLVLKCRGQDSLSLDQDKQIKFLQLSI